ncbi:phage shock protein C (PspC) family protein [Promicromonospora umidemergens]|uniref:Phage shock protein PspC N-terminal domain-containing protein n=1 Tax=Promicromonospora umidemergens TaxID=629679 RepID=A0ABP8Y927_9MICO|nr:PspC domain-containing protein [Promicromonospora umidemergens]MCP2282596.1 phage shock protein C (PspC) family protein [Promicromonospora umidemergens]
MSTDETRPEGATSEPGGSADAGPASAGPVGPDANHAGPAFEPAADPGTGPTGPTGQTGPTAPTPDPAPVAPGQKPYPESGFFASIRRGLFPRSEQRWVGGVAGGLAERVGWDPLLVRGLLIVSFFLGGLGLILYGVGWALLPERDGRIHLQEAARGNFDVAMLGSVAVFLMGFAWGGPLGWWDDSGWDLLGAFFWLAVVGGVVYLIVQGVQRQRDNNAARRTGAVPGVAGMPGPGVPTPGVPTPGTPTGTPAPGAPRAPGGGYPTASGFEAPQRPGEPGTSAPFTPAPPVSYRRPDGLVYATGAGPAPHRQKQAPYRSAPVPTTPPQPVYTPPPARAHRGPGGTFVGITVGVILLAGALILGMDRLNYGELPGDAESVSAWLGIGTVVLGVAIFVSAMRGRTSGLLGFFAIVAMLFGLTYVSVAGAAGPRWVDDVATTSREVEDLVNAPSNPDAATLTDGTVVVQTLREAENGFYVRWGEPVIDLSELDLSEVEPGEPVTVPIQLGAGMTEVMVPENVAVEASAYVAAGAVEWNVDDQSRSVSGVGSDAYFASDEVEDERAVLRLDIEAGAGEVIVSETKSGSTP